MSQAFLKSSLRPEDYWRAIVLYGRNVASYKFALARTLLDIKPRSGQIVKLEELAVPFSSHIRRHLASSPKQSTSSSSRFLECCVKANTGDVQESELIDTTTRLGFNNVIDAFHIVGRAELPTKFFSDERETSGGIRITDEFSLLTSSQQSDNLLTEVEARWNLVETAWNLSLPVSVITYDNDSENLVVDDSLRRRQSVTGAREALSGYQKGHCFYCFEPFSLIGTSRPDIDHFFPHLLKRQGMRWVDEIWNLVLACAKCNRGSQGKFENVPSLNLLSRLEQRNNFLIDSHHPLRETLMRQTGNSAADRADFLRVSYQAALTKLIHTWEPAESGLPVF